MAVESVTIRNHTVFRDADNTWRWYDVIGPNAVKWDLFNDVVLPKDANDNPSGCTTTEVGTNTCVMQQSTNKNTLLITTGGTENNGLEFQAIGEAFYFGGQYPAYFCCEFQANDVDQVDVSVGLIITDTTAVAGCSDGIYFRTADESTALYFVLEKDSAESTSSVDTLADATWVLAEWYYDGGDYIRAYIDGTLAATVAVSDTNFPDDEHLTPTIGILTGDGSANTLTVRQAKAFQIYE